MMKDNTTETLEETSDWELVGSSTRLLGWTCLPDVCLRQVFMYLSDHDRCQALLVCHRWRRVMMCSPQLWRTRSFHFKGRAGRARRSEHQAALCYTRILGRYLEELEVRLGPPLSGLVARRLQVTLRALLEELSKVGARLRSLTLRHIELDHSIWVRSVRNSIVRSLTCFLRREGSHLGHLCLQGARLTLRHGMELLQAASVAQELRSCRSACSGILSLDLQDFFSNSVAVYGSGAFPRVMWYFWGLESLSLSYSCMSDELLETLASACGKVAGPLGKETGRTRRGGMGSLRSLSLWCHQDAPHAQVVSGMAWTLLARSCSELAVHIHVERIVNTDRLARIMLPEVPVCSFSVSSCYFELQDWSAKPIFGDFLPQYRSQLQKLSLDLNNCNESLNDELSELVLMCKCLVYLKAWAFLHTSFMDILLQGCLEKKCALKIINVRIYTCEEDTLEEEQQLEEVLNMYRCLTETDLKCSAIIYPLV